MVGPNNNNAPQNKCRGYECSMHSMLFSNKGTNSEVQLM